MASGTNIAPKTGRAGSERIRSATQPMPQIDFGQAFSNSDKSSPGAEPRSAPETPARVQTNEMVEPARFRRSHLGGSDWANIIFAVIAIVGGLFFAFYFFNGAELLREAKSWPRDYFYSQPGPPDDAHSDRAHLADSLGLPALRKGKAASRESGDPFSRTSDLLNPPNSRLTRAAAGGMPRSAVGGGPAGGLVGPGSPLSNLGLPAPGGDALTHTFDKAVSGLQPVTRSSPQRTVHVVKTTATRAEKHAAGHAENSVSCAQRTATHPGGRAPQETSAAMSSATSGTRQTQNSKHSGGSGVSSEFGRMRGRGPDGIGGRSGGHGGMGGGGREH